ncbi:hypothetical protein T265_05919 [Opisthorchis viverrini]|uniref:PWWP domain-containing protein n=1 Tax=Opisthorchis viverrini TaxID=6198 RepID=A0A075AEP8_OPIVI|nr:hypothetical protein T265_05919 [Opisthorchis viverrini]KER26939.1 hypothetical protein T265_05919 [Opisthorchis viverrini]
MNGETMDEQSKCTTVSSDIISLSNILLRYEYQCYSQYGVNHERVRGTPFWPPLTTPTTGINLKTIPCSTERYSYKLEGQASCLNVFQPDAIKRSNRNQPAPQLSRILRPRRFVCRKCKKAYHIKENGTEMSSGTLPSQTERVNGDSSAANSDNELAELTATTANGKMIRRNQTSFTVMDASSQSIKHVTPSIIPKLNEDYTLSGRESEVDSNSDDPVVNKRRRIHTSEKSAVETSDSVIDTSVAPLRHKPNSPLMQRSKKSRRVPPQVASSEVLQSQTTEANPTTQQRITPEKTASVVTSDSSYRGFPPQPVPKADNFSTKPSDSVVRKNRIKAQYVSVATPFRFPPSRSSKPNLLSITQLTGIQKDRGLVTNKRPQSREGKSSVHQSEAKKPSLNESRSPSTTVTPRVSSKKFVNSSDLASSRYRTRSRPGSLQNSGVNDSQSNTVSPDTTCHTAPVQTAQQEMLNISTQKEAPSDSGNQTIEDHCMAAIDALEKPVPASDSSDSIIRVSVDNREKFQVANRTKATDYEKPKNRWIREARARRSQEERTSLSVAPPLGSSAPASLDPCSTACDPQYVDVCAVSPSSTSRLRSRSNEPVILVSSNSMCLSPKSSSVSKKRSQQLTICSVDVMRSKATVEEESTVDEKTKVISTPNTTYQQLSPHPSHQTETTGVSLPVLKIKINRQNQSSADPNSSAQYEVVGSQVTSENDSSAATNTVDDQSVAQKTGGSLTVSSADSSFETLDPKVAPGAGGMWTSSPTLSGSSSRKGTNSADLGHEVKKCRLSDGTVFRVGDLVWSKLSGWPSWPAQITSIHRISTSDVESKSVGESEASNGSQQKPSSPMNSKRLSYVACLHWFAWHQVSYMPCDKLFHFLQHYKRFDNKKKRGIFRQAVNEARHKSDEKKAVSNVSCDSDVTDEPETDLPSETNEQLMDKVPNCSEPVLSVVNVEAVTSEVRSAEDSATGMPDETIESTKPPPVVSAAITESSTSETIPPVTIRRGSSHRGRTRSLRGRRGCSVKASDCVRSSPRNLPIFIPSEACVQPFAGRRRTAAGRTRGVGRGRGRKTITQTNSTSTTELPHSDRNTYIISEPSGSSGTLKIVLSTSGLKLSHRGSRKDSSLRRGKPKNVQPKKLQEGVRLSTKKAESKSLGSESLCEVTPVSESQIPEVTGLRQSDPPNTDPYSDPSAELLSQFPHVFPDLRASGILSDAVDIPTFSEDESEEEDAGRLIIDPDVMASVNSAGSLSIPRVETEQHPKPDTRTVPQEYYNTTYFTGVQRKEHMRSDLCTPYQFMPVTLSRLSDTVFSTTANSNAPSTVYSIPTTNNRFSSLAAQESTQTHVPPALLSQTSSQLGLSHSPLQQLPHHSFDTSSVDHRLSSYFRPSSQTGAPITVANNVVPYLTSNYPNL